GGVTSSRSEERPGDFTRRAIPCPDGGVEGTAIALVGGGTVFNLGKTAVGGKLTVDLVEILPGTRFLPKSRKLLVRVGDVDREAIDIGAVITVREAAAWASLSLPRCAEPKRSTDCSAVAMYLDEYSDSAHATEVRKVLDGAQTKLNVLRDAELWAEIQDDAKTCGDPKAAMPDDIERACTKVRSYQASFPEGAHVADAKAIAARGEAHAVAIRVEWERHRVAEERAEKAAARAKCVGVCRIGCSSRMIRDPAACYAGCVASRCE
ncbi:MAG: hypothetical protein ACHREM_12865, partial [Polyangiales bacterium]